MTKLNIAQEEIWPVYRIVSKTDPPDGAVEVDISDDIAVDFVNRQQSSDLLQMLLADFYQRAAHEAERPD